MAALSLVQYIPLTLAEGAEPYRQSLLLKVVKSAILYWTVLLKDYQLFLDKRRPNRLTILQCSSRQLCNIHAEPVPELQPKFVILPILFFLLLSLYVLCLGDTICQNHLIFLEDAFNAGAGGNPGRHASFTSTCSNVFEMEQGSRKALSDGKFSLLIQVENVINFIILLLFVLHQVSYLTLQD